MVVMGPYVIMGMNYIGERLDMTARRLAITCWLNGGPHHHRLISAYAICQAGSSSHVPACCHRD